MKRVSTVFLRILLVLVALVVLAALVVEPQLEGRNENSTLVQTYFQDPFLAYVYIASIPFFGMLFQAFQLLRYADSNQLFSKASLTRIKNIQYLALSLVLLIIGAEAYFFLIQRSTEDIAGGVVIGLFAMLIALCIASVSSVFHKHLQTVALKKKS